MSCKTIIAFRKNDIIHRLSNIGSFIEINIGV